MTRRTKNRAIVIVAVACVATLATWLCWPRPPKPDTTKALKRQEAIRTYQVLAKDYPNHPMSAEAVTRARQLAAQ